MEGDIEMDLGLSLYITRVLSVQFGPNVRRSKCHTHDTIRVKEVDKEKEEQVPRKTRKNRIRGSKEMKM